MDKKKGQQETRRNTNEESGLDRQVQGAVDEDEAGGKRSNHKRSGRTSKLLVMP